MAKDPPEYEWAVGARVRAVREWHGLSRAVLASLIGYSVPGIARIEYGQVQPRLRFLEKLSVVTGVPIQLLLPFLYPWDHFFRFLEANFEFRVLEGHIHYRKGKLPD